MEENIQQHTVEELRRYSNAVSAIGISSIVEEWISQNELTERTYTEADLLSMIIELYIQINNDFKFKEHIHSVCQKWIHGQPPIEISNEVSIEIMEVEKLCNKNISYEINFLIGNISDLIVLDEEDDEHFDPRDILAVLQKKVKYGVPNMTAISVCESVFNDRLLAVKISQILSDENIEMDKILNVMKDYSEEIFSFLDSYPKYFKDKLSVLM